jgi:hypothetical protein
MQCTYTYYNGGKVNKRIVKQIENFLGTLGASANDVANAMRRRQVKGRPIAAGSCPIAVVVRKRFKSAPDFTICSSRFTAESGHEFTGKVPGAVGTFITLFDQHWYPDLEVGTGVPTPKKPRLKKFRRSNVHASNLIMAVRDIAKAEPNRVYTKTGTACLYKPTKQADGKVKGCIIGEALIRTGISTNGLKFERISVLLSEKHIIINERQASWLSAVQTWQDIDHSWGEAVEYADSVAPLA